MRRRAAEATGLSARTIYRYEVDLTDLREVIELFKSREMLRPAQLAKRMGIPARKVHSWLEKGEIESYRVCGSIFIPVDQMISLVKQ